MKTQLISLDLHFLLNEIKQLEGSRVDQIYSKGKEEIYFQFFKSGSGKKVLRVILGKSIFLASEKDTDEAPSEFCMLLRKHLEGKFLDSIIQLEPERILKFALKTKEEARNLYIEFFGGGNIILCNEQDVIINSLIQHKFKDRLVAPKEKYVHPHMGYNIFNLNKTDLSGLLKKSSKDKVITCLAVELGLGGIYSEEVCLLAEVDKNKKPGEVSNKEEDNIIKSIKKIISSKSSSKIIYKDKEAVDVVPIDFEFYNGYEANNFSDFNSALEEYFTKEVKIIKKDESASTKQINELKRIIEEQKATLENMKGKENEDREKAELIYSNYQLIKEVLDEINKASKKYSWQEIKAKLKGHKIIKDLDVKDKLVVVDIP
jgi:predicted ribosome quality control (RQC) complex YloA/Tae2 family protein